MRTPNSMVRTIAQDYVRSRRMQPVIEGHYVPVDTADGQAIAELYTNLPACKPTAKRAYAALAREVLAQWHFAVKRGIVFEAWNQPGQPYANSTELCQDVSEHQHMYFFTGGEVHPFLGEWSGVCDYTINDCFRAVHDLFGHCAEGYQFGPCGEHNAWLHHSMMFSKLAQRALTSETRGQNSWVNFGPYASLPACDRPFADQKAALLPAWVSDWKKFLQ